MTGETKIIVNPDTRIVTTSGITLNNIVNVGGEKEVYKGIVANTAQLRTLKAGTNISITEDGDVLLLEAGVSDPFTLIGSGATTVTNPSGATYIIYSPVVDLTPYLEITDFNSYTGDTETRLQDIEGDISGNTANIAIVSGKTDTNTANIAIISGDTSGLRTDFNSHTGNTDIHYVQSAITISENQVTNLIVDLNGKVNKSDFNTYTGTTQNTLTGLRNDINTVSGDTAINATNISANTNNFSNYVPASGGSFIGNLQGTNLQLSGDLTVNGSMNIVHAEDIYTENDFIFMRSGATTGLGVGEVSGIAALNVDGTGTTAVMGVTNDGIIRVGWSGDTLVAVAGREDSPLANGYAYWDDSLQIFKTYDLGSDVSGNTNSINTHTGDTSIHFTMAEITGFTTTNNFNTYTGDTDTRLDTIETNVSGNTADIDTKADKFVTVESISASTYTIVSSDNNRILEVSTGCTITMPTGLTNGFQLTIVNTGTGTVTFNAGTGATLLSKDSKVDLADQYGAVAAYFNNNNWTLIGDLS